MIITIGNTKGGVGKTTIAVNIAIARALQGREVWLIDADRQGTSQEAIGIRSESEQQPGIACAQYVDGPVLRSQVQKQAPKFDDIVIDAGGRDSSALRAAMMLSDILLVPFIPRSFDVWALRDMAVLIDEARSVRDDLTAYAVLNSADPNSVDNSEAAEAVLEFSQFKYLDSPIKRRKAFADAAGQGLSVLEAKKKDRKAEDELNALLSRLF